MATDKIDRNDFMHGLGANERALLERIPVLRLRRIAADIVRTKMRVQFTGWLQYIIPLLVVLPFVLIGGIAHLFNARFLSIPFLVVGGLVLLVAIFDLVTVKFRLHPQERLPKPIDDPDVFDLMRARHSCRSFQTRQLTPNHLADLMESVRRHSEMPTIGQAPIHLEYIAAPLTVWPVVNATEFFVAIAPKEYNRFAIIDVGRTLQKIVIDATRMGLATCWIGPGADPSSVAQALGDRFNPQKDHVVCVCAVGYQSRYVPLFVRFMTRGMHQRLPLSQLFFADRNFQTPLPVEAHPFNRLGRTYEVCQWSPSSYNGQTTRCVAVMEQNGDASRLTRFDFYQATESRYYAPVALGIWCADWETGCGALGIDGHFALLSAEERGADAEKASSQLPRYDVSWVLDGAETAALNAACDRVREDGR